MKYYLKRFWPYLTGLFGAAIFLVYLNQMGKVSNEIFLGGIATLLTLYFSVITYYQSHDRFFKDLFTEFNNRYNELNNFLNTIKDDQKLDEKGEQKIMDYLNLCAEEYMWVTKGRIPIHIWQSWLNGIQFHLKKTPIREVFEKEKSLWKSSYYGFFDNNIEL